MFGMLTASFVPDPDSEPQATNYVNYGDTVAALGSSVPPTALRQTTAAEQYLASLGNAQRENVANADLRPERVAELMRLQGENASLRAALADERAKRQAVESDNTHIRDMITRQSAHHADLVAKYAALFSLHIKQPAVIPDAAPEFPVRALQHQRQPIGLLTGRGE